MGNKKQQINKIIKYTNYNNIENYIENNENYQEYYNNIVNEEPRKINSEVKQKLYDIDYSDYQDNRSKMEYFKELIINWILEDVIKDLISRRHNCKLSGADENRDILNPSDITTKADLLINNKNVEVITDYGGYWESQGYIDLRYDKYKRVREENYAVLCLDLDNEQVFMFTEEEVEKAEKYYNEAWGKECYKIKLSDINKYTFNWLNTCITKEL